MELEFRKFLTTFGITYEEYENMTEEKKQELINRFNNEIKQNKIQGVASGMKQAGKGCQSIGCALMLIPIAIIMLIFLKVMIFG